MLLVLPQFVCSQETFRDEFNSVSYSNNDGTVNWTSEWIESGDTDSGPSAQYIYIQGGELRMEYLWGENIRRSADLAGATAAVLSFDYTTNSLGGSRQLGVFMSDNGGASYTQIATISGNGSFSQDISAYISSTTTLRFARSNQNWQSNDWARVDNVQISANIPATLSIENISVDEDAGTAIILVTHAGANTSGAYTADYISTDDTAVAGEDYTAVSGTLSFNGTAGDTETIMVPITDDGLYEVAESFTLSFTSVSDPSVNISSTGTVTITDDEVILDDVPLALYRNINGNYDYTTTGGTFRTEDNSTDPCAITTSSSGDLTATIPGGATIREAYLFWSHSAYTPDSEVTFEGTAVTADLVYSAGFTGRNFYGYISDVTDVVSGIANPNANTFDLTDLDIDTSSSFCGTATVLGAWSLMVFYEEASLPASTINLYYGFDITQNAGTSFTLDSFYAISPTGSTATFLSYEGDATLDGSSGGSTNPEELSITNEGGTNFILSGDGGQTGNNAYNSTIYHETAGVNSSDIHGLDLDTYDISSFIGSGDSEVTANVDVGQDLVISSAVVIRVPSNLISGTVFEDINYPGGAGRNQATASGVGVENARVEIYDAADVFWASTTTDTNGDYSFGGMPDGDYKIRVVNPTVRSTRGGGSGCIFCYPIQTFRTEYDGSTSTDITDEIGGANPAASGDAGNGILTGAQTVSPINIAGGGVGNIDFGFNFNTIVNTNEEGQGSLEQFIVNANSLDETGLDIQANSLFDPAGGEDVSIFMIPPSGDPLGRTPDGGYTGAYFDILISNGLDPTDLISDNTHIDGRTQTAYSGNTNIGTIGAGGAAVGTTGAVLPDYDLPEVQIHRNVGDVFVNEGANNVVRNVSVYANSNTGIGINAGSLTVRNTLLGVNAVGANSGDIDFGIEVQGGAVRADGNYIATTTEAGIVISGGSSSVVQGNHFFANGNDACDDSIRITSGAGGTTVTQNLIENSASLGIDAASSSGNLTISENTITASGQVVGTCGGGPENMGIKLAGSNSTIRNNSIHSNGGAGLATTGGGTANLISQNSFYTNGTTSDALGIDLDGDGVTLNDSGDSDSGFNNLLNFPIISAVFIQGTNLVVKGWSRPGATLEFYFTDINEGAAPAGSNRLGNSTDYGEGQVYFATVIEGSGSDLDAGSSNYTDSDGNTDTTNRFHIQLPLPSGTTIGELITATATLGGGTSEFAPMGEIRIQTVITNRRITYRVNPN